MTNLKTAEAIQAKIEQLQKETPRKWKIQNAINKSNGKCSLICVPYYDARVIIDHLNQSFGFLNWQREHFRIDGKEYCRLKVRNPENGNWLIYEETGTKSFSEGEKGETSDAFKRAAVNLGIGRDNYDTDIYYVKANFKQNQKGKDVYTPIDSNGYKISDLSFFIERELKSSLGVKPEDQKKAQKKSVPSLLEQIATLGIEHPEILTNCVHHARENGFNGLEDASNGYLAKYLVRLQMESKNSPKAEEDLIKPLIN